MRSSEASRQFGRQPPGASRPLARGVAKPHSGHVSAQRTSEPAQRRTGVRRPARL